MNGRPRRTAVTRIPFPGILVSPHRRRRIVQVRHGDRKRSAIWFPFIRIRGSIYPVPATGRILRCTMRTAPTYLLVLSLVTLGAFPGQAQGKYSQATYITASQFLAEVKEVSLDLRTDSSLTRIIPLSEQRSDIDKTLAAYGITVRPNSPVTLEATVTHTRDTIQSVNRDNGQVDETTVVQGMYIGVRFMLRAAAWRHGRLHWVNAAPAIGWSGSTQAEDTDLRKMLLGDQTRQDLRRRFGELFSESLQSVADTSGDPWPWPPTSWTEATKAAADVDYASHRGGSKVDLGALQSVSRAPDITLAPNFNHDSCKPYPAWESTWTKGFEGLHWTDQEGANVAVIHFVSCVYAYGMAAPRYFALSDRLNLYERNVVFELNGKIFRRWGVLFSLHHEQLAIEENIDQVWPTFIPQCIQDALNGIEVWQAAAGDPDDEPLPAPAGAPAEHPAGAIPHPLDHGTLNTMFRGKKVVSWNKDSDRRWYYEDGSPVEQAYHLDGVVASPLFDYQARAKVELDQALIDRLGPMRIALSQEIAKYPIGGQLTGRGQTEDELQHDLESMTCVVREYAGDQGTVHFCTNLQVLDMARAEITDSHVLIPCRDHAACVIAAGTGGSTDATRAVTLWDQPLSASLSTALSIWTTSRESGQTILALLKETETVWAKLMEPTPVVSVP